MTKQQRIDALETAIRKHRAAQGQDLCWLNDLELWDVLKDGVMVDRQVPPWPDFMAGCIRYRQMLGKPPMSTPPPKEDPSDVLWVREHQREMWHKSCDSDGVNVKCGRGIPGSPLVTRRFDDWDPPASNQCKACLRIATTQTPEDTPCNNLTSCTAHGDLHDPPKADKKPVLKTYQDYLKAHADTSPWPCFLAYLFTKIDGEEGKVVPPAKKHSRIEQVRYIRIPKKLKELCHRDIFLDGHYLWGADAHFEDRDDVQVEGELGTTYSEKWKDPDLEE